MPSASTIRRHTPALAGTFDATQYANKLIFASSSAIALSSSAGVFDDVLDFLHGYGSAAGQDLGALVAAELTAAAITGTMTAGIDENDRFFFRHDTHAFELICDAEVGTLFGFVAGTHPSNSSGGGHVLTATLPFARGVVALPGSRFKIKVGASTVTVPSSQRATARQSLPVWVNVRSGSSTLADAITAGGSTYIDATGRVVIEQYTGRGFDAPSEWPTEGKLLWARLGGTGTETKTTSGLRQILTATHPCPGFLAFDKQYVELKRYTTGRDDRVVLADGSMASAGLPPLQGWEMTLRAGGPALGFAASREQALRDFFKFSRDKITFFPMWGDLDESRGAIETRKHIDQRTAYSTSVAAYSTTKTIEADVEASHFYKRKGGRLFLRRASDDNQRRVEDYGGRALDVFQDVKFKFLDDPTR